MKHFDNQRYLYGALFTGLAYISGVSSHDQRRGFKTSQLPYKKQLVDVSVMGGLGGIGLIISGGSFQNVPIFR